MKLKTDHLNLENRKSEIGTLNKNEHPKAISGKRTPGNSNGHTSNFVNPNSENRNLGIEN